MHSGYLMVAPLQPSVALINPKSWNASCGLVVSRFAVVIVVCTGLTLHRCISPSFVGTVKVIFGICTAWKSGATVTAHCLTFASGLQTSASWMTMQAGDWPGFALIASMAMRYIPRKYLKLNINCRCQSREVKHIHQGNIINRNYCTVRPRETKFTFIYYPVDLQPINVDIWMLIANLVSYFICIYALWWSSKLTHTGGGWWGEKRP